MQNPARLRAIYAELRRAAGKDVAAADLLRLAYVLFKTYRLEFGQEVDDYGLPADSRAFAVLPVDEAMEDGGWRVLNFEWRRRFCIDEVGPRELSIIIRAVRKYLGPEWPQQTRED